MRYLLGVIRIKYPVVLASASPRRQQLLKTLVSEFTVEPAHLDEDALTVADPWQTAQILSREKALAVFESHPDSLVIAGDTVVAFEDGDHWTQLSKPTDRDDARRMLRLLEDRTHNVLTGVTLRWPKGIRMFVEVSQVTFREIGDVEMEQFLDTGESMDKAGAYGFQGIARTFVKEIRGSENNVIGLPTEALSEALKEVQ